jgi:hypothetical protein
MQFAKDSFYMALQTRLAALSPARTVTLNGALRPAVIVMENEYPNVAQRLPNAFYLEWGAAKTIDGGGAGPALTLMACSIFYYTNGNLQSGVDRGRTLGQLDSELLSICRPGCTEKRDYSQAPSKDLGTGVFWTLPDLDVPAPLAGQDKQHAASLERRAHVTVGFFPEGVAL